jgi:hypothetical protein
MNNNIFSSAVPTIAKHNANRVFNAHRALVAAYGVDGLRPMRMKNKADAAKLAVVAALLNRDGSLNDEKLAEVTFTEAKEMAKALSQKATAKVGALVNVTALVNGLEFNVTGTDAAGRSVELNQTMTVNVSTNGIEFLQFPCRIYINGKFTAEAKV